MTDEEFISMTAECIRGEHGEAARFVAGSGCVYAAMLGTIAPGFQRFVDDVNEEITTQEEHRIMDMLSIVRR